MILEARVTWVNVRGPGLTICRDGLPCHTDAHFVPVSNETMSGSFLIWHIEKAKLIYELRAKIFKRRPSSALLSLLEVALCPQATGVGLPGFYLTYSKCKPEKQRAVPKRSLWVAWLSGLQKRPYICGSCFPQLYFLWVSKSIRCFIACEIPST